MIASRISVRLRVGMLGILLRGPGIVAAQTFPDHAIKVGVPLPVDGPTDSIARVVTQGLAADLVDRIEIAAIGQ
jgi:tripartite-type tricarboxylate transporter receptor subunit TctC